MPTLQPPDSSSAFEPHRGRLFGLAYRMLGARAEAEAKTEAPKQKGVGGRLRAAADRLRGKKKDEGGDVGQKPAPKPSRGVTRKTTTPRKAGGS